MSNESIFPKVSIFLACRDRVNYLEEVIESILQQEYKDFVLIISDNSVGNEVRNLVAAQYPALIYRWRNAVNVFEHFNQILEEVETEYFVIFHDDDAFMPGYLSGMMAAMNNYPNIAAVGCNAHITWDKEPSDDVFAHGINRPILISIPEKLFEYYVDMDKGFHAPFPSYMYRTAFVHSLRFSAAEGGKYSDVSFLMKLVKLAPIVWIPEALIRYRFHSGNDSNVKDIKGKLSLLRFVLAETQLTKKNRAIDVYRASNFARWILPRLTEASILRSRKNRIVIQYLISRMFCFPLLPMLSKAAKKAAKLLKSQPANK